jgi:hypothetical protein
LYTAGCESDRFGRGYTAYRFPVPDPRSGTRRSQLSYHDRAILYFLKFLLAPKRAGSRFNPDRDRRLRAYQQLA